jgi:TonB family protein
MKAGKPVPVACTLSLVWGPEDFTSRAISSQVESMHPAPQYEPEARLVPLADSAIVSKTEPEYTDEARRAGLDGTVPVLVLVDQDGKPASVRLGGGLTLGMGLEQSAMDAIKEWRFTPPSVNGYPTTLALQVSVHFRLSGVESSIFFNPPKAVATVAKPQR